MIYGAMLAGGVGSRMKSATIPKQFLEVDGQPIILYTLRNMLKVKRFDYIYIATHKDYIAYMEDMVKKIRGYTGEGANHRGRKRAHGQYKKCDRRHCGGLRTP